MQTERNNANTMINMMGNLDSQYQHLTTHDIGYFTTMKTKLNKDIANFSNVINEITIVQTLDNDSKNTIYNFYSTYIDTSDTSQRVSWMRRLPYNVTGGLLSDVGNLMADGNITSDSANCVVDLICKAYEPKRQTMGFTNILFKQIS